MVIKDIAEIMEPNGTNISLSHGWYEKERETGRKRERKIEKERDRGGKLDGNVVEL